MKNSFLDIDNNVGEKYEYYVDKMVNDVINILRENQLSMVRNDNIALLDSFGACLNALEASTNNFINGCSSDVSFKKSVINAFCNQLKFLNNLKEDDQKLVN